MTTPLRIGCAGRYGSSLTTNDTASLKTSLLTSNFTASPPGGPTIHGSGIRGSTRAESSAVLCGGHRSYFIKRALTIVLTVVDSVDKSVERYCEAGTTSL